LGKTQHENRKLPITAPELANYHNTVEKATIKIIIYKILPYFQPNNKAVVEACSGDNLFQSGL
jgi:hypothetical protein